MFLDFSGKSITEFMRHLRSTFPEVSITPKLHLLEHHCVDFIKKWKAGFGLYGEQGAEGIHPAFNNIYAIHSRMKPAVRRLKSVMDAHLINVNPKAQSLKPVIKKRKVEE